MYQSSPMITGFQHLPTSHNIQLLFNGQPIKQDPFVVEIIPTPTVNILEQPNTLHVKFDGQPVKLAKVEVDDVKPTDLTVKITGPDGPSLGKARSNPDGTIDLLFTPKQPGQYEVFISQMIVHPKKF